MAPARVVQQPVVEPLVGGVGLVVLDEPGQRELAHGLQEPVATRVVVERDE